MSQANADASATVDDASAKPFWNPYVAGVALGLVLLTAFLVTGSGLGASGAANRLGAFAAGAVAPMHVASNPQLAKLGQGGAHVLDNWLVFMVLGVFLGGALGAYTAGRLKRQVIRGKGVSAKKRLIFALAGGLIMGVAARLALGCTSGQALSGGALLSAGSWIFMFAVFGGGYAVIYFLRRQWQ
jgi:uncharacterized membrane protein YedE/YeeE